MPLWPFQKHSPQPFLPSADPGAQKKDEPPKFVDEARFTQALDEVRGLNSKLDQFTGLLTGYFGAGQPGQAQQGQSQQQQAQEPTIPDISDDEYADAVLKGDAAKIATRTAAIAERKVREVRKEYDQRFRILETQGMSILDQVNTEVGQQGLATMPYYQLLKSDIDTALKQLPAHQRTPEMRAHIYHATVGINLDKVKAHDAAEAVRIQNEREQLDPPGRRQSEQDLGPTPESIFGEQLLKPTATWMGGAQIWGRRSPDSFAQQRYGTKDMKEAAVYAANVMALGDCPRCFGPVIAGKCHCRPGREG